MTRTDGEQPAVGSVPVGRGVLVRRDAPTAARSRPTIALVAMLTMLLTACAADAGDAGGDDGAATGGSHEGAGHGASAPAQAAPDDPLRAGERRLSVAMPEPYQPSAPTQNTSDDYRCFLLDPGLEDDVFVTGTDVTPGDPSMVHHVILFQVPLEQVASARALDSSTPGQGWTCFGGTGLDAGMGSQAAPWLGAWTPGGTESVLNSGYGAPLAAGSQLVMQVHYSLLAGDDPDVTTAELRVTDGSADLAPVSTMLLPAPVELPCRPEHADGPLCDRDAALEDVTARFGESAGSAADRLHGLCPGAVPGPEQSCTTTFSEPATIIGVAGHMHLLGRSIRIEVIPDTGGSRTVLDVPVWNFHDQRAEAIEPVEVDRGDRVRVTCEHDQELRDDLPAFEGQPDRYVLWGDGTTDEMCAGILQIAPPQLS